MNECVGSIKVIYPSIHFVRRRRKGTRARNGIKVRPKGKKGEKKKKKKSAEER